MRTRYARSATVDRRRPFIVISVAAALAGLAATAGSAQQTGAIPQDPSRLLVVDCLLPGQVRKLGGQMTYMSPRRPVKTVAVDCEIRGGEYTAYDRANYATSLAVWMPQAEGGDPQAQVYVGEIFEKGLGRAPDPVAAAAWYEKAAAQKFARGQMNLAYLYEQGLGVPKDPLKALNLYREASGITDDSLTYVSEVTDVRTEMQRTIDDLTAELETQNDEVSRLKSELESNQSQLSAQRVALNRAQGETQALARQVEEFRSQTGVDPARVAELKQLEADLAAREQKVAADERTVAGLEANTAAQRAALAAKMRAAAEGDLALRNQLAEANQARDELQAQLIETQRRLLDTEEQAAKQRANLTADRARIAADRESLAKQTTTGSAAEKQQRDQLTAALADRERKVAEQQASIATLLKQQQSYTAELTRLRAEQAARAKAQGGTAAQVAAVQSDLAGTQQKLAATEQQVTQLRAELSAERGKAAADRALLARQASTTSAEAQKQRDQMATELAAREKRIADQQARIATLEQQQKTYTAEIAKARAAQQASGQTQQQQQAQLSSARSELASTQRRLQETEQRVEDLTAQLEAERSSIALERAEIDRRAKSATGAKQVEIERLRAELATRETALAKQQTLIASLQAESKGYQAQIQRLSELPVQPVAMRSANTSAVAAPPIRKVNVPRELQIGQYYALIIGNNRYQNLPSLDTPIADASAVDEVLRTRYGFKTKVLSNASRADILTAINDYRQTLKSDDSLLIYYAGHGELDKQNLRGYWLPVNAQRDNTTEWISDQSITDLVGQMAARHVMIVADSCYSGVMTRNSGIGLIAKAGDEAQVKRLLKLAKLPSRTVLTSGGQQPVLDAGGGGHSIFARAFMEALRDNQGVLEGSALYGQIFDPVRQTAAKYKVSQEPRYSQIVDAGHLNGEFLFIPQA
jgi:predicted  nucleic acid-binding Zn-ribbon protein